MIYEIVAAPSCGWFVHQAYIITAHLTEVKQSLLPVFFMLYTINNL